ncbi:MAG TPA: hypothetical protein VIB39_05770 [Candidatus Angelobacter sp.]|jgi:hypothetical protein
MRSLLAAVLISVLICPTLAQQSKQQWRPYIFPDDGFAISLPGAVTPHDDAGDRHIHVYTVRLSDGSVFSLRAVHKLMDCETTLADLWDKADGNKDPREPVVAGSLKEVSLDGLRGLEYVTTKAGEKNLHRFHCGNKIFYMFSAGYKGKRPPELDRIINSFHQVNPVHK